MNIVVLTGRLASVPEVKTSQGGKQYANASMVVQDATDKYPMFVDIVVFERNLQALQSTKKGGFLQISGKLNIYNPKDQAGQTRSGKQIKIVVDSVILPIEKSAASQDSGNTGSYQPQPGRNGQSGSSPAAVASPPEVDQSFDPFEE